MPDVCGVTGCSSPQGSDWERFCNDHHSVPAESGDVCKCRLPAVVRFGPHRYPTCEAHYEALHQSSVKTSADPGSRLVCPHCQTKGRVRTKQVKVKKGISGGKATGAVLTGGLSMLATGLSRKTTATQMTCGSCRVTWTV
jgi:hypothetical protein